MTTIFKPEISQPLMKMMQERFLVKMTLESTGLTLKAILEDYYLIVPSILSRECWMVIGPKFGPHGDLIEKTLKLAWSYTHVDLESELYQHVCDQVSAYEPAMEVLKKVNQNRKNSKLPRPRIPSADLFIEDFLRKDLKASKKLIWQSLPESYDEHDLYKDGDVLYSKSFPLKQLII